MFSSLISTKSPFFSLLQHLTLEFLLSLDASNFCPKASFLNFSFTFLKLFAATHLLGHHSPEFQTLFCLEIASPTQLIIIVSQ